jgi:RHS repeat-associated protein
VITQANGAPCYDADFYPFGGETTYTNTCPQNYKFTGKERDSESGLDNFIARYNSSSLGRFMSPDPDNAGAIDDDPQTWNAYSYVRNNPLRYTDRDGLDYHVCVDNGNGGQNCFDVARDSDFKKLIDNSQGVSVNDGKIFANGVQVGTYQHFIGPGEEGIESANGMNMLMAAPFAGLVTSSLSGAAGGASVRQLAGEVATGAAGREGAAVGEQVVATGTKAAVRQAIEDAAISNAQKAAVKSALSRAGSQGTVTVEKLADGSVRVLTERAGRAGSQVIEKVIDSAGNTASVVQKAYDVAGNLVHVDPKFP